ncbi:MAG: hypothetical protein MUO40_05095, partial [Anaerolineaceae bacterium]|nr:hypothetical protein [Anaerolineaceae bacterium]
SLLLLIFALVRVFTPDPYATQPIKAVEVFLLSFWGVAIIALMLGWKWERLGAYGAIGTMILRELVYFITTGEWTINFLIFWVIIIPPAILYLLAYKIIKNTNSQ